NKTAEVGRIRYVIIPDSSAAKAALLSGNIDLDYDVLTENIAELKTRKELILESAPSMDKQAILFQTRNSLLKDPRMRRAIALSLDVPELVSAVTTDTAQASRSILSVASGLHKAAQAAVPKRDLVQARRLLAAAGYRGQPIKLLTTKRFDSLYGIAVMAQAMAQEAGIRLEIEVLEWATLLDRYNKGDYQAMAFAFSARLDPALAFEMIAGDKDKQPRKVWDAPDALDQVARLSRVTDAQAYQALLDQLEAGLRDQVPAVFLYSSVTTSAARKNVKGYRSWVFGEARLWGVSVTKP
ncbi:MAG TPA: ABC transporter substrate-binding protein, partial [Roseateles sp.]|uniref:ABC transporter substrate-binding protein n=1 Tax=Roseateles sp. TaxID=1971397 RepID=UPI002ED7C9D6